MVFPADPLGVRAQCYWLLPPPPEPPLPPAPPEPPLAPAPPAPPAPAPLAPAPPAPAPESLAPVAPAAPPVPVAPVALAPDPEEVVAPPPAEDPLVIVGEFVLEPGLMPVRPVPGGTLTLAGGPAGALVAPLKCSTRHIPPANAVCQLEQLIGGGSGDVVHCALAGAGPSATEAPIMSDAAATDLKASCFLM